MSPEQIAARLRVLRDRTGEAVCLTSDVWCFERAPGCEPVAWKLWVGAHRTHYEGTTAEAALTAAEDASLSLIIGSLIIGDDT